MLQFILLVNFFFSPFWSWIRVYQGGTSLNTNNMQLHGYKMKFYIPLLDDLVNVLTHIESLSDHSTIFVMCWSQIIQILAKV